MTSLGQAMIRIAAAAKRRSAPKGFKAAAKATASPVDLVVALVKWAGGEDDESLAGLDETCARCCRLCAEAVKAYGFHGLGNEAGALLERLPAPAVKAASKEAS